MKTSITQIWMVCHLLPFAKVGQYILTGLIPLSMQIDQETLLIIGQLINLPHTRYEVRTYPPPCTLQINPHAEDLGRYILHRYELPDLHSLLSKPIPYTAWKSSTTVSLNTALQIKLQEAIQDKPSLSFFENNFTPSQDFYLRTNTSKFLRQAVIIRAQLLTQTYLTQSRLTKIKKTTNKCCQLCKEEEEDILHFVTKCPQLRNHRQKLLENLHTGIGASLQKHLSFSGQKTHKYLRNASYFL